jgi:hypothetical protein
VLPLAMELLGAVIAIEVSVAAVIVNVKLFEVIELWVAVMCADPTPAPVASPPAAIVTADRLSDAHVTELVMLEVEPSLNVPVAVN